MSLLAISLPSWEKCLFRSSTHVLTVLKCIYISQLYIYMCVYIYIYIYL